MKTAFLRSASAALIISCSLGLVACSDDGGSEAGDETGGEGLEIVGEYIDNFMTAHSISEDEWSFAGSVFAIAEYDNDAMYVVAQNGEANDFNPGLWSRFDWAWDGEQLYYCQSVYDGPTIEDARAGGADAGDLAMGCGGFAWTMLNPS